MVEFSTTCRCCLKISTKSSLVSLFQKREKNYSLSETLQNCTNLVLLQVYENDGLPSALCTRCAKILHNVEKLKQTSIKSDSLLRKQLAAQATSPEMRSDEKKYIKSEDIENVDCLLLIPECEVKVEEVSTLLDVYTQPEDAFIKNDEEGCLFSKQEEPAVAEKVKRAAPRNQPNSSLPTEDDFACCMCVKFCKNQDELTEHLKTHTILPLLDHLANNPAECKMCFHRFKNKKNLKLHLVRKYRPKSTKINQCKHCGKIFVKPDSMRYCEQKHEGRLKKYECDLCKATFGMRTNMKTHMQLMHIGIRKFACDVCGDAFKQLAGLQRHTLTHTGVRNFSCELCGKAFSTSSSLVVHKRVHTGERPYTCSFQGCDKTFIHTTDRERHKLTHTGERPYNCAHTGCKKKFRTRSLMKNHFRMHIGVKEFKCTLCPVEYFQPRSLKRHMTEKHAAVNLEKQGKEEELSNSD